jgi:tetratricopeptide (TPR) repeat protein
MLDCQVYGLNPWGHHLTSVLLHALNSVLVFLVLRRLTGATWRSLMVAGLFGLHPLRVESVAWISERKDVLCGFFWMLTLWSYTRYVQGQSSVEGRESRTADARSLVTRHLSLFYILALLFFALGLMSKSMLATLPCVLLLLDYWPLNRISVARCQVTGSSPPAFDARPPGAAKHSEDGSSLFRLLLEKVPFFLMTAIVCAVTYLAQKRGGMMNDLADLPFGARAENALVSYCRYLGKLFWPADLCAIYPHPGYWPAVTVLFAGLLVSGVSVLAFAMRRQCPYLLTGWLWYLGTFVPVIGLVQVGHQSMADRYSYVPSIGVLIALVWGMHAMTRGWRWQALSLSAAGGAAALVCAGLTRHQCGYWKDDLSVYNRALAVTENNFSAHNKLARALVAQGRLDAAIGEFQEAVRLKPDFVEGQCSLGKALALEGRLDEALAHFQAAVEIRPDNVVAQNNLGNVLFRKGRVNEALVHCQRAVEIEPFNVSARNNLGFAFFLIGNLDEAAVHFQKALEIQPDNVQAHNNLGNVLLRKGRMDPAIQHFQMALNLQPGNVEAHNNLGSALLQKGQLGEAVSEYEEAVKLEPDSAELHRNLGCALRKQGNLDAAIREFKEALALKPDYADANSNLDIALGMKKTLEKQPAPSTRP